MQGIYIHGRRPKSKKEVREHAIGNPRNVSIEATSLFGNEYHGPLTEAPDGRIDFCGPDPHHDRRFYGSITIRNGTASVK